MPPQAKEHLEPPEAGRAKDTSSPGEERDPANTLTLDFWPPELWKNKVLLFKPEGLWSLGAANPGEMHRIGDCRAGESGSLENQVQSWVCCWWLRWTLLTLSFRFVSSSVPHMPGPHSWAQGSLLTWRSYSKSKEVRWDTPYLFGTVVTGITTLLECWIHTRYVYIHYLV